MATTGSYKEHGRLDRVMTVEDLFNYGMSYVDTPLPEGYVKLLVNFDLKNQGTSLVPRGGLKTIDPVLGWFDPYGDYSAHSFEYTIHHVGSALVESYDGTTATLCRYILVTQTLLPGFHGVKGYTFQWKDTRCYVEIDGVFTAAAVTCPEIPTISLARPKLTQAHGCPIEQHRGGLEGVYFSIDNNTYIPMQDIDDKHYLARLVFKYLDAEHSTVGCHFEEVIPRDVLPTQAINAGYNMLKSNPYDFKNTVSASNAFTIQGIIPKDNSGVIKLTANVGEDIIYYMCYTYPASQGNFCVQWEVNDLNGSIGTTQVLQSAIASPTYAAGQDVMLPYNVTYKQYTIIAKVFLSSDIAAYLANPGNMTLEDAKQPIAVMTVSSYYTTADVFRKTTNLAPRKYAIPDCTGACTWQQRAVVWGVPGAESTAFMSQPNLPEYFPYPNNIEIFPEEVICCVPYLTDMLVFTATRIYKMTITTDGVNTYTTTKCIQESLPMSAEDATTIRVVKNMVFFKSGNYFYMIVPNNKVGAGELQLAPVSKPIESLLDNFTKVIPDIMDTVWDVNNIEQNYKEHMKLINYSNYLDGAVIKNVYKYRIPIYVPEAGWVSTRYVDFTLNYDTTTRAWTTYLYEAAQHPLVMYENTVTNSARLASVLTSVETESPIAQLNNVSVGVGLFTFDVKSPKDESTFYVRIPSTIHQYNNYQLIDTGYRTHYPEYKKRFREIQFSVNNISKDVLHFYTAFTVDDDVRKGLYTHITQQITDSGSADYGLIYVERILSDPYDVPGTLTFDEDDGWALDFSKLEDVTVVKVRYKVSGKGYNGKIQILSKNESLYELMDTVWVYRKMNGR